MNYAPVADSKYATKLPEHVKENELSRIGDEEKLPILHLENAVTNRRRRRDNADSIFTESCLKVKAHCEIGVVGFGLAALGSFNRAVEGDAILGQRISEANANIKGNVFNLAGESSAVDFDAGFAVQGDLQTRAAVEIFARGGSADAPEENIAIIKRNGRCCTGEIVEVDARPRELREGGKRDVPNASKTTQCAA